jgi:hypothetical protein
LVRPLYLPCDICFGFMILVFCIFDKSVHAVITVCTLLDTMRVHLIVQPIFPYVSPADWLPVRTAQNSSGPLIFFKTVLL